MPNFLSKRTFALLDLSDKFNLSKVLILVVISLGILIIAIYEGWLSYQYNPFGIFLYTPNDWCAQRSHSFSSVYEFILIGAVFIAIITTVAARLIFKFSSITRVKHWSDYVSQISLLLIPILFTLVFIYPIFETAFPLQANPACKGTQLEA